MDNFFIPPQLLAKTTNFGGELTVSVVLTSRAWLNCWLPRNFMWWTL
jgi:hypothetical protein